MVDIENCDRFLLRNLRDACCDEPFIKKFLIYCQDDDIEGQIRLLKCHRCTLLDSLHQKQKQIDCLDYLVYTLKKCQQGGK